MDVALDEDFVVSMVVGSELTYGFNWAAVLAPGESIVTSSWTINNTAFDFMGDTLAGNHALIRVGGGVAGRVAHATNTIVTSDDNRFVKRIRLVCIPG